jgi:hypothetical protein
MINEALESMKWIPYLELMARRPKSLQNLVFYKELPDPWKEYLADTSERKRAIRLGNGCLSLVEYHIQ